MHDWRNFNSISFKSTMIIVYDNSNDYSHTPHNFVTAHLCFKVVFLSGTHCTSMTTFWIEWLQFNFKVRILIKDPILHNSRSNTWLEIEQQYLVINEKSRHSDFFLTEIHTCMSVNFIFCKAQRSSFGKEKKKKKIVLNFISDYYPK